jgi:hypothetical protein
MKWQRYLKQNLRKWEAILGFFLLGAAVGTACDAVHVASGVESYPALDSYPFMILGTQAPWVPLLMGTGAVVIAWLHLWSDRWIREGYGKRLPGFPGLKQWIAGFALAVFLWCSSGYLPREGLITDVILAAGALFIWMGLDRTAPGLIQAGITAVSGVLVEYFLSSTLGLFQYDPAVIGPWGVPSWLAWLYVAFAPVVAGAGRRALRKWA